MDLVSIMNRGSVVVRENNAADNLRRWAEVLVNAASGYEGFGVVAASPQAERVLGAAMMLDPTLNGDDQGPSIVFDMNYTSGTLLARAARRLRDRGNQSPLVGMVLNPLIDAVAEIRVAELDFVSVVPKRVSLGHEGECSIDRVSVLGRA